MLLLVTGLMCCAAPLRAEDVTAEPTDIPSVEVSYRELATRADIASLCEIFMLDLVHRAYDEAFGAVRPYFPISDERFTRMRDEARKQHALAELQFGKPLGHALAREELVNDTVLKLVYLEKYEWDALVWEFTFYKPTEGWIINGISFDDGFRSLFRQ